MVLFVLIDGTINCALCKNILLSVKLRHTTITHGHVTQKKPNVRSGLALTSQAGHSCLKTIL